MTNSEAESVHAPSPMEGHGAYNRSSRVQAAGLAAAIPLLRHAAETVPLAPAPEPIVIADYGCSEGHNSLIPMREAIAALRQRVGTSRTISVVHTDLPSNDFSALFEALESDPDSYLRGEQATFASAVGRSFYRQLLPSSSVTLGWSSWSVQWLSRTPALIPDQVQVAYSHDANACAAFARQAAEDWHAFLVHRADELRPGGQLVVLSMAKTDDGDFGYRLVIDALIGALMDLAAEGVVSAAEIEKMAIPTYGRTRAEFAAPFADSGQHCRSCACLDRDFPRRGSHLRGLRKGPRCRRVRPALGGLRARFDVPDAGAGARRRRRREGRAILRSSRGEARGAAGGSAGAQCHSPCQASPGEAGQRGLNPPHHCPFRQRDSG